MDRDALFEACRREDVKMQPVGWTAGDLPTWPQLLRTIYLIRCNLFHGAKSPQTVATEISFARQAGSCARSSEKLDVSIGTIEGRRRRSYR
jgi:hypothetical protein